MSFFSSTYFEGFGRLILEFCSVHRFLEISKLILIHSNWFLKNRSDWKSGLTNCSLMNLYCGKYNRLFFQEFQNGVFQTVSGAPWFMRNWELHKDLIIWPNWLGRSWRNYFWKWSSAFEKICYCLATLIIWSNWKRHNHLVSPYSTDLVKLWLIRFLVSSIFDSRRLHEAGLGERQKFCIGKCTNRFSQRPVGQILNDFL